jgi:ABC-type anion transport system duplicated permease subunit
MEFVLILFSAVFYALAHLFNSWLFHWIEISNHISWVYLPGFLRLFYVLVLGRVNGFIAIFLGGMLLANPNAEPGIVMLANNVCSALAPVLACIAFERWRGRTVSLSSLKDLLQFTVIYSILNTVLHHLTWFILDASQWHEPLQVATMVLGDLFGAVIGVGLMKAAIERFGLPQTQHKSPNQD